MKQQSGHPVWLWMNLLSLDAPLVALVWQDFLSRSYPSVLLPGGRLVLGLSVWAIYLTDRLMDVQRPPAANEPARHRFCREHRKLAIGLLTTVLIADLCVAVVWLRPAIFRNGLVAAFAVLSYFAFFVCGREGKQGKHASAAFIFTVGVFLVAWTRTPKPWQSLSGPAVAFYALCYGNLVLIEKWEQGAATSQGWIWMGLLAAICALCGHSRWYAAVASSGVGLALLDFRGATLPQEVRRVLADAVLLTPLLIL
jgi:hypothetical protein